MTKTVVKIDGMACGMCEAHVNDIIRRTFKVKKVSSSHRKGTTEIVSDEPIDAAVLSKVLGELGYSVISIAEK